MWPTIRSRLSVLTPSPHSIFMARQTYFYSHKNVNTHYRILLNPKTDGDLLRIGSQAPFKNHTHSHTHTRCCSARSHNRIDWLATQEVSGHRKQCVDLWATCLWYKHILSNPQPLPSPPPLLLFQCVRLRFDDDKEKCSPCAETPICTFLLAISRNRSRELLLLFLLQRKHANAASVLCFEYIFFIIACVAFMAQVVVVFLFGQLVGLF